VAMVNGFMVYGLVSLFCMQDYIYGSLASGHGECQMA